MSTPTSCCTVRIISPGADQQDDRERRFDDDQARAGRDGEARGESESRGPRTSGLLAVNPRRLKRRGNAPKTRPADDGGPRTRTAWAAPSMRTSRDSRRTVWRRRDERARSSQVCERQPPAWPPAAEINVLSTSSLAHQSQPSARRAPPRTASSCLARPHRVRRGGWRRSRHAIQEQGSRPRPNSASSVARHVSSPGGPPRARRQNADAGVGRRILALELRGESSRARGWPPRA